MFAVMGCLLTLAVWRCEHAAAAVRRADVELRREVQEGLPVGSDRSTVERFLNSHGIPNGRYLKLGLDDEHLYSDKTWYLGASAIR